MKKTYQTPQIKVVIISQKVNLLGESKTVTSVSGGVFNETIKAGSGQARSRGFSAYDDEEEIDEY